jgi:hydrogenase nickel incorporation protein HypA/HybF
MHEYSVAYDLYATSRKTAIEHNASLVKKVTVELGKMAMVNREQVAFLFDAIKENDPLFTTTLLECEEVLPQTRCSCGYSGQEQSFNFEDRLSPGQEVDDDDQRKPGDERKQALDGKPQRDRLDSDRQAQHGAERGSRRNADHERVGQRILKVALKDSS